MGRAALGVSSMAPLNARVTVYAEGPLPPSVALAMVPLLLGAAFFGHGGSGFNWSNPNGGWEYAVMWSIVMAALALLGDGPYALLPSKRT